MRHCRRNFGPTLAALTLGLAAGAFGHAGFAQPSPGAPGKDAPAPDGDSTTPKTPPPPAGPQGPSKGDPAAPPPTIPRGPGADSSSQPMPGQGTVKGSTANSAPDGVIPGGRAGSGGHKTNEFGR